MKKYSYTYNDICRNCGGTGRLELDSKFPWLHKNSRTTCPLCQGSGRVIVHKTVTFDIEAYKDDNDNDKGSI